MAGGARCAGERGSERGTLECQRPRARQRCRHTPHKSARKGVGGAQERRSERSPLLVARGDHGRVHAAVERRCWRAALHPPPKPPPTPPHPTSLPGPVRPPLTPKRPPTPKPNPLSSPTLALAVCSAPGDPPPPQRVRCGVGEGAPLRLLSHVHWCDTKFCICRAKKMGLGNFGGCLPGFRAAGRGRSHCIFGSVAISRFWFRRGAAHTARPSGKNSARAAIGC